MTELLPCPLCGSTKIDSGICYLEDKSKSEPAVRCVDCGCRATLAAWGSRALAAGPQEPALWICFADNGNIRAWTREHNRKELFRLDGLDMQPFYATESQAKATEGKAGMAVGQAHVRGSTAGTGLRVGAAGAVQPATSEIMDVTAGETAPNSEASVASAQSAGIPGDDLSHVFSELGDIEVDENGMCQWTDVANAQTLMKLELRRALKDWQDGFRAASQHTEGHRVPSPSAETSGEES